MSIENIKNKLEFAEANPDIFDSVPVLDKGFVRLVDWMGDDARIVESARVSYQNGTKAVRSDAGLINYLVRHRHTSPLEQVEFTFHLKLPLFVFAQLVRHRMASVNSESARYSVMDDEFYIPEIPREQSQTNKQGSVLTTTIPPYRMQSVISEIGNISYTAYETLLKDGIAREMARMVLPQNLYTEVYWKQDLHNLFHMLSLRMDAHAQWEIQEYARTIFNIVRRVVPLATSAWERYTLNSTTFSANEMKALLKAVDVEKFESLLEDMSAGEKRESLQKLHER